MIEKPHRSTPFPNRSVRALASAACAIAVLALATQALATPYFILETDVQWSEALLGPPARVTPLESMAWDDYMTQWDAYLEEGDPYPENIYVTPQLYVYGGGGGGGLEPEDAGLVMMWQAPPDPVVTYSAAWRYDYSLDPNLSNSTITVTVTAPQFDRNGNQVNNVSFGIQDINGFIRSWHWRCGAGWPIPWNVPTQITINTALTGLGAATPPASGYMNNPGFNISQSLFFIVDENASWVGGTTPVPPPGLPLPAMWNYWHNILVSPNIPQKGNDPLKWSQPVVAWGLGLDPPIFLGWDELSVYRQGPIVADDWQCTTDDPVTDIHWWGSFLGWDSPQPPPLPMAFHIAIWTDVPDDPANPDDFSHPGQMIWEHYCDNFQWNFAGYDHDPRNQNPEPFTESCFQFVQYLTNPEEWFYQDPNQHSVYWLSIAAIYNPDQPPQYPWGWKTRPHFFMDDAVRIFQTNDPAGIPTWPPHLGYTWANGNPIEWQGESWDVAFELTTRITDQPYNDLGDAPDSSNNTASIMTAYPAGGPLGVQANFPTVYQTGSPPYGPIHLNPQAVAYLGAAVTLENEADIGPDQDPTNNLDPPNDTPDRDLADDGVIFPITMSHCQASTFQYLVNVVLPGQTLYVNVWCDWNRDGDWDDTMLCPGGPVPVFAPEWAVQNQVLSFSAPGLYIVTTPQFIPWHPTPHAEPLWMRITLADQPWQPSGGVIGDGGSGPSAGYVFGETEDYYFTPEVAQEELDFGDAPDPTYPTLLASNGARHAIVAGMFLGAQIDSEADGQPNATATGDDTNNLPDEDGVVFTTPLRQGQVAKVIVTASVPGMLDAWVDFNVNGSWADAGEQVFTSTPLAAGPNLLTFNVPAGAAFGQTFARFRFSTAGGLAYTGLAQDGEVEDYSVVIEEPLPPDDFGDAPAPYPTLLASNGARHTSLQGFSLGNLIDTEVDGLPDPTATGDDTNNLADEDGVTFNTAFFAGVPNTITVRANVPAGVTAYLNAWIDFNGDGDWVDAGEQIFTNVIVLTGVNNVTFVPSAIPGVGNTFARFRLSSQMGLSFTGPAPDGEVEDYMVNLVPVKWIQPPDQSDMGVDVDNHLVQLADDFRCTQSGPIRDIHIWTSFYGDILPMGGLNSFPITLCIYADVPVGPGNPYSHPGDLLWSKDFAPGGYDAGLAANVLGEWWFDPTTNFWHYPGDTRIYQYDFYIDDAEAYRQRKGTVYWLGMKYNASMTDFTMGWKSSPEHWNDDACWLDTSTPLPTWRELRYGDGHPMAPASIDLAFALTGKPCYTPQQDTEGDYDVDLMDFAVFRGCFNGPNRPWQGPPPPWNACSCFDDDDDGDVDLMDFAAFRNCFNGPNRPPNC